MGDLVVDVASDPIKQHLPHENLNRWDFLPSLDDDGRRSRSIRCSGVVHFRVALLVNVGVLLLDVLKPIPAPADGADKVAARLQSEKPVLAQIVGFDRRACEKISLTLRVRLPQCTDSRRRYWLAIFVQNSPGDHPGWNQSKQQVFHLLS